MIKMKQEENNNLNKKSKTDSKLEKEKMNGKS